MQAARVWKRSAAKPLHGLDLAKRIQQIWNEARKCIGDGDVRSPVALGCAPRRSPELPSPRSVRQEFQPGLSESRSDRRCVTRRRPERPGHSKRPDRKVPSFREMSCLCRGDPAGGCRPATGRIQFVSDDVRRLRDRLQLHTILRALVRHRDGFGQGRFGNLRIAHRPRSRQLLRSRPTGMSTWQAQPMTPTFRT